LSRTAATLAGEVERPPRRPSAAASWEEVMAVTCQ
jgi:hypothetical protein